MLKKFRRILCVIALAALAAFGFLACTPPAKAPCASGIVLVYTAEMVKAGCTGEHFNDAKCEPIKAKRLQEEKDAGCL